MTGRATAAIPAPSGRRPTDGRCACSPSSRRPRCPEALATCPQVRRWTLAGARARSGDPVAVAPYQATGNGVAKPWGRSQRPIPSSTGGLRCAPGRCRNRAHRRRVRDLGAMSEAAVARSRFRPSCLVRVARVPGALASCADPARGRRSLPQQSSGGSPMAPRKPSATIWSPSAHRSPKGSARG
jgi:hypothetical protein